MFIHNEHYYGEVFATTFWASPKGGFNVCDEQRVSHDERRDELRVSGDDQRVSHRDELRVSRDEHQSCVCDE